MPDLHRRNGNPVTLGGNADLGTIQFLTHRGVDHVVRDWLKRRATAVCMWFFLRRVGRRRDTDGSRILTPDVREPAAD